ncbi:hypothetical protein EST38_g3667 [Candolleomyces aberdarensis]|uniref:Uncharacterized protein n=1 Tax=Candolleomyces aberdarensis TaxID=2316362 RepID=A0A4Q2DQ15_9AGAR|nr:hypothetical protein EST38_g3667 [Candolleomyces aberdarensis]
MPGVVAENGNDSPSNEPPILPSSRRAFKPRRKPAPAPIQTVRVDYDILEDDDEPIVDLCLYTPPTPSASSAPHISPLALKLTFKPSPYPSAMQRRFRNLSAVLTDDNMQSLAPSIYSISITIPTLSNGDVWVPQGLPNPFDGRTTSADIRVDHPSVLDGCSPLRYRNLFPSLREFRWSGALGKRYGRGSRSTGALPAPFYDLTSLPFRQLQTFELRRCAVTLSDCRHILRSCSHLRVCVVDRIVDVDPGFFEREPLLKGSAGINTVIPKEVLAAYPIFLPLCDPDHDTSHEYESSLSNEPLLSCPHLHTLHLRTTVDLCHFFSTFNAPDLRNVRYAPVPGRGIGNGNENMGAVKKSGSTNAVNTTAKDLPESGLGIVTVENFPWNIGWENIEKFELVVSEDMVVQDGVEDLLNEIAGEEDVIASIIAEEVDVR